MGRLRCAVVAGMIGVSGLGVSACTGGSSQGTVTPGPAKASSIAPISVKVGDTVPLSDVIATADSTLRAAGSADVTMTRVLSDASTTSALTGLVSFKDGSGSMYGSVNGHELSVLRVGNATFAQGSGISPASGSSWVRADSASTQSLRWILDWALDPVNGVRQVKQVTTHVVAIDAGVTTYEAVISPAQFAAAGRPEPTDAGDTVFRESVDALGRPVGFQFDSPLSSVTFAYSGWGRSARVVAPPVAG